MIRRRLCLRVHRAAAYHGLVRHPYGQQYARAYLTPLGGTRR